MDNPYCSCKLTHCAVRLLVGRITDIADQMNKFEETMIAMMAAKS